MLEKLEKEVKRRKSKPLSAFIEDPMKAVEGFEDYIRGIGLWLRRFHEVVRPDMQGKWIDVSARYVSKSERLRAMQVTATASLVPGVLLTASDVIDTKYEPFQFEPVVMGQTVLYTPSAVKIEKVTPTGMTYRTGGSESYSGEWNPGKLWVAIDPSSEGNGFERIITTERETGELLQKLYADFCNVTTSQVQAASFTLEYIRRAYNDLFYRSLFTQSFRKPSKSLVADLQDTFTAFNEAGLAGLCTDEQRDSMNRRRVERKLENPVNEEEDKYSYAEADRFGQLRRWRALQWGKAIPEKETDE